jgi:hypothetical protein
MHKGREEWEADVRARQRNTVFPDTVQNEGRFWRNLVSGKQRLTTVQTIGIVLIFLPLVGIAWREAVRRFTFGTSGSTSDRLVATAVSLVSSVAIPVGLLAVLFLLLRWRVRRALLSEKRPNRPH